MSSEEGVRAERLARREAGDEVLLRGGEEEVKADKPGNEASGDGVDVYFKLQNARVTGGYAGSLGPDIASLVVSGHIHHANALKALLRGEEAPEAAFERWREIGSVDVSELSVARPNAKLSFSGRLVLDGAHDLSGTLHGRNGSALEFAGDRLLLH